MNQCSGWAQENRNLDYLFFYKDLLHLLEKGNSKLAKSILASIINSVFGDAATYSDHADAVSISFKDSDFPPLKRSSSVVSKTNNQSAAVDIVIIHKSVNSFVARKPVKCCFL